MTKEQSHKDTLVKNTSLSSLVVNLENSFPHVLISTNPTPKKKQSSVLEEDGISFEKVIYMSCKTYLSNTVSQNKSSS